MIWKPQVIITILFFSSFAWSQTVRPGLWQADSIFKVNGIPLPASKDEKCISASDAKNIKNTLLKELREKGCESTRWLHKKTSLEISLKCSKDGLEATGILRGHINERSYELRGEAEGTYHKIPSKAELTLIGNWRKKCS